MRSADNASVESVALKPTVRGKLQAFQPGFQALFSRLSILQRSIIAKSVVVITHELEELLKVGRKALPFSFLRSIRTGFYRQKLSPDA